MNKQKQTHDSFTNLLTIAMPVFERKEFFREALESALNQTVKCKVIVIDNCSSHDYFKKICKEKNVQYFRNETNIGLAANFATSFELAETKYVMNLQDDDLISSIYVESFLKALVLYPDIDIFFSDFVMLTSIGELSHKHILPFGFMENGNLIIEFGIKHKLGFPYMSSAIKRIKAHSVLETKAWIGCFDWEWIYSVADHLSFYGDSRKLYHYRIHDKQITKTDRSTFIYSIPYIYDVVLKEKVTDPQLIKIASRNAMKELFRLKSEVNRKDLKRIFNGESKYDKYLITKFDKSYFLKMWFLLPTVLVNFLYKGLIKLGFLE